MHTTTRRKSTFASGIARWATTHLTGIAVACALIAVSQSVAAQVLVFDRGLPTANLNNTAGANQSNVIWADDETPPVTPYLPGDDFILPGTGPYVVNKIRVWSTDSLGLSLRGGVAGGAIGLISTTFTATSVTYTNSQSYQTASGAFLPLYQIDFTVNIPLNGGVPYQFFLGGPAVADGGNQFRGARLHASNAALSGSTQTGSNGTFLFLANDGTAKTWNSLDGTGTLCTPACPGWNKVSDGNVQVFAAPTQVIAAVTPVPTMTGAGLAGLGLLLAGAGAFVTRRRRSA
ncbi:MAG: hypothetical protein ABIZ64_03420 [Casimicrobium sp.]